VRDIAPAPALLVASADEDGAGAIAETFRAHGYRVTLCANGEEVLARLAASACDLLITAVSMPALDGLELLMLLKERMPDLPVIAIAEQSRDIDHVYLRNAQLLGAVATFARPLPMPKLVESVSRALKRG
jgi:CheY-like chemotaxis protein